MPWTIRLTVEAEQELARIPKDQQVRIKRAIERMKENPFTGNVQPLKEKRWKGVYRKTVGRYRLFFIPFHSRFTAEIFSIRLRAEKTYR